MIKGLATDFASRFPRNNYGFANAIRTGELRFDRAAARLSLRNPPQSPPYPFYDCTTAARYVALDLQKQGMHTDKIAIRRCNLPPVSSGDPLQHLTHELVLVKEGKRRFVIGVTPFDEQLGIPPLSEYSRWGCLARSIFFSGVAKPDEREEAFTDPEDLVISKVMVDGSPFEFENLPIPSAMCAVWRGQPFDGSAFLAGQHFSPTLFPSSRRFPPSVVETLTILIAPFWAGKHLGSTGIQMRFDPDGITLVYAAQVVQITRGLDFNFKTLAQLGINLHFQSCHFPVVLEVLDGEGSSYQGFYNRLVELGIPDRKRIITFGAADDQTFEKPLDEALSRDWPVVEAFLRKLPDELISFPNP